MLVYKSVLTLLLGSASMMGIAVCNSAETKKDKWMTGFLAVLPLILALVVPISIIFVSSFCTGIVVIANAFSLFTSQRR